MGTHIEMHTSVIGTRAEFCLCKSDDPLPLLLTLRLSCSSSSHLLLSSDRWEWEGEQMLPWEQSSFPSLSRPELLTLYCYFMHLNTLSPLSPVQREGSCMTEDDSVDIENENGNRFEEYEWCGQKRIRATTLLEGGFRGSGFIMCSGKENPDSDADLDVDGDDTLEYGKPQYTEADVIPCTGEEPGEAKEREALRGAVLNGGTPSTRITPEFSKWASDEMPSTSNGESSKQETMQKTCKNSDIEKITEDSAVTTFEALKARVRELERQLSRGDRYKCLICMDSYTMPLTSIQCWHVHCEECWLRTLGAKKLCPQCNTITSPGDLRRIYL
uniref:E3 ubiquitin-protein ligase RNF220 n=1 Tax=Pavo cristatus TaxID=9049 RepID=A0A8C9EL23_PAVCR